MKFTFDFSLCLTWRENTAEGYQWITEVYDNVAVDASKQILEMICKECAGKPQNLKTDELEKMQCNILLKLKLNHCFSDELE